ncbi:MAG: hypothetical protein R3F51_23835 [Cyanobacteriota/Melainabacteria group bacterium]
MSLEDKKSAYLKRMAGMLILFAILGSIVLCIASSYFSKVIDDAIPAGYEPGGMTCRASV